MLKNIRDRRLSQPYDSPFRMEEACKLILEDISNEHGYHRDCYQYFTKNLDRLTEPSADATAPPTSRSSRSSGDMIVFNPNCIFCKKIGPKSVKLKGSWTNEFTSVFEFGGWHNVADATELGEFWTVSDNLLTNLEEFTCALYGKSGITDIDKARFVMLKEKCNGAEEEIGRSVHVDMSLFPPCNYSLHQHIRRVNYQVAIWKRAHEATPTIPSPSEVHGWTRNEGNLEPLWTSTCILPQKLVDVLESFEKDYSRMSLMYTMITSIMRQTKIQIVKMNCEDDHLSISCIIFFVYSVVHELEAYVAL